MLTLLVLAMFSYGLGFAEGAVIFVVIGALFEIVFWLGVFRYSPAKMNSKPKHS
ncbi:hypothetical protein [Colwellia sp. D2M02]|nr:hypothetical protein [Colwellia sp. D2M02]